MCEIGVCRYMYKHIISDFLSRARHCKSVDELSEVLQSSLNDLGFPVWAYATYEDNVMDNDTPIFIHNYPDKWVDYYTGNNCIEIDPVVAVSKNSVEAFKWSHANLITNQTNKVKDYNSVASEFEMFDGVCIPIIGGNGRSSLLSISSSNNDKDFSKIIDEFGSIILSLSFAFHSIAKDLMKDQKLVIDRPELTEREKECLLWTAKGKSVWDISVILNISERTVLFHLSNAKKKFNVSSKYHLMAIAIAEGYIKI